MRIKIVIGLHSLVQNFRNIQNIQYSASLTPTETKNAFNNSGCKFLFKYCPFIATEADVKSESKNYNPATTALQQLVRKIFPEVLADVFSPGLRNTFRLSLSFSAKPYDLVSPPGIEVDISSLLALPLLSWGLTFLLETFYL